MKTWWDILLEKRPELEKYPGSLAKPFVYAAEQGNVSFRNWMHQVGLWLSEFE